MKKLLTLLFSILISFNSYGLTIVICVETDAQIIKASDSGLSFIYFPNNTKLFTGKNLCKFENGQNKLEGKIKDGRREGRTTNWYENGQKFIDGNYKDGRPDSKWTYWKKNGQKDEERNYKDGDLVDKTIFKYSYLTGHLKSEKKYQDGECTSGC